MPRSRRLLARCAVWILPLAVTVTAGTARADDEAVQRFERGVQLYEAQNYEGALVEFSAAYKLSKNYKLLYNIGICQMAQKEYAAAAESFKQYLAEGSAEITESRKADVKDRLSKLSLMVTQVRITTDAPAGSQLLIDDRPVGTAPFSEPVTVKIGRRVFSITANGRTATKSVDVASGDGNAPVSLMLGDTSPGPANNGSVTTTREQPVTPSDDGPSFPILPWGLTVAVGAAAAVTGILAVNARNDFEEKQNTFGTDRSALESDQDKAKTLGIVTDVLLAGTVIGAGISTWLTIRWAGAPKKVGGLYVLPTGVGYSRSF